MTTMRHVMLRSSLLRPTKRNLDALRRWKEEGDWGNEEETGFGGEIDGERKNVSLFRTACYFCPLCPRRFPIRTKGGLFACRRRKGARFEILIRDELPSRRLSFSRSSRYLARGYEPRSIWETTRKRRALQNLKSLLAAVPGRTTTVAQIRNEEKNRNEEKINRLCEFGKLQVFYIQLGQEK